MSRSDAPNQTDRPRRVRRPRPRPLDVAIVGMACRFPGAPDVERFWANLLAGRDCTGDVPPDRWDPAEFFDPFAPANDLVYCQRGGYLEAPIGFDPARHGVMPIVVAGGEPEQFLVLDAARAALEDAGLSHGVPNGRRVEVVVGRGNYFNRGNLTRLQHGRIVAQTLGMLRALHPEWTEDDLEAVRADLKASLPPFEAGTVAGQLTNATAGRLADRFNLSGASYVVDAASASSLVALDLGARALVDGRADLALVGGVYLAVDVDFSQVFCLLGALSRKGSARPFTANADGTLPGEGVGVVVLKRLADAERDGDRIYAVVKGVGLSSDGRAAGLAAPSARGHALAIRRAYRQAGLDAATVGLVQGHGLGVPASDRAELRALRAVFPKPDHGRRALGSVSPLIGHAMPAAGMAGLIAAALALHHRVVPATPHADDPHPSLRDEGSPFELVTATRPWIHGEADHPRRAGVNAFGFAGVNAHAVLEEHEPSADGDAPGWMNRWDSEVILLGANDRAGCLRLAGALLGWLETGVNASVTLKDLAHTLNAGQAAFPVRVGLVAGSTEELGDRLRLLIERLNDPRCTQVRDGRGVYFWETPLGGPGRLAFLFPGEGSQYPGMLADLCPHFPVVRRVLDATDQTARRLRHAHLPSDVLFGPTTEDDAGLWSIGSAVNVVLSSQWALYQLLMLLGIKPDAVVGHSSGEILALAAAGTFQADSESADRLGDLRTVFERLEQAGRVPGARLFAVAASRKTVDDLRRDFGARFSASVAIDNCPHQVVLAVAIEHGDLLAARLKGLGLIHEELPFRRAYHTPSFAPAIGPIHAFFRDLSLTSPSIPIYSCSTAARMPEDVEAVRTLAVEQWVRPVEFRSTIEAMHADGVRLFVEVGARGNLAGSVEDTLRGRPHLAIAANLPRRSGLTQLNHLVATLYAHGVPLDPSALYARRRPVTIDLSVDLPLPTPLPTLAVGFPKMRLSEPLAKRLRDQSRPAERDEPPALGRVAHRSANGNGTHAPGPNGSSSHARWSRSEAGSPPNGHGHRQWLEPATPVPIAASQASPPVVGDAAMLDHFRTMERFLDLQREVMEAYLSSGTSPLAPSPPAPLADERELGGPEVAFLEPIAVEKATPRSDVREALLEQVARRTGYPREVLALDQDMEADLGIDSIKRVEVLGELQDLGLVPDGLELDRLSRCRTLGQVLELLDRDAPATSSWPGEVVEIEPGRRFVGLWPLDAERDPVARHHTLGGRRQSELDPTRLGLPVVPFTVMAEMLAQAAAVLRPGRSVVALRDLTARRWVPYTSHPSMLELHATATPERPDEVRVTLNPQESPTGRDVAFEGLIVFGGSRAERPVASSFPTPSRACRFSAEELYRDQWLFHGEPLQALVEVGGSSPAGIVGTIRVLPRRVLFPESAWPRLRTDPIVIDAFTHLLGAWGLDKQAGEHGDVMFPLRVAEIALFGDDPDEGASIDCRIQVRSVDRRRVRADAELLAPDGRVWVQIRGWEDWRFYWPGAVRDAFRDPRGVLVGEPIPLADAGDSVAAVWFEPPEDVARPIWGDVLEWVHLGPEERLENAGRGGGDEARRLRAWGKIAAKDAVRRLWLASGGRPVYPADLVLDHDPAGRPLMRSLLGPSRNDLPAVSIAHSDGVAVAIAARDPDAAVGIDVEPVRPRGPGFEAVAFSEAEQLWLDTRVPVAEREEWVARFWCGKEAVGKATGLGLADGPRSVEVIEADPETGRLLARLAPALADRRPDLGRSAIVCETARRGERVWAWTIGRRADR